jgi:uncharacterized protein YbjT (DUF2867 family)
MDKTILLVGASGQLGTKIFEKLNASGYKNLHILAREDSSIDHLMDAKPTIHYGDLTQPETLMEALRDVDIIITTANAAIPRKKQDTIRNIEITGNMNLIDAAKSAGVRQFIFTSGTMNDKKVNQLVPLGRSKLIAEDYLKQSGVPYTIFRPTAFMDVYLTFLGTDIPAKNEKAHVVNRPWKFMNNFYNGVKNDIQNGQINFIGKGDVLHSYIAVDDVAEYITKSVDNEEMIGHCFEIGGPEELSAHDVKGIFEDLHQKPLKIKRTPPFIMLAMGKVYALFDPSVANMFMLNYVNSKYPLTADSAALAKKLGIHQTTVRDFLIDKMKN